MAAVDLSKKDSIQQHFPLPDNRTYKSVHPKTVLKAVTQNIFWIKYMEKLV